MCSGVLVCLMSTYANFFAPKGKKVAEIFGGSSKSSYLCIR